MTIGPISLTPRFKRGVNESGRGQYIYLHIFIHPESARKQQSEEFRRAPTPSEARPRKECTTLLCLSRVAWLGNQAPVGFDECTGLPLQLPELTGLNRVRSRSYFGNVPLDYRPSRGRKHEDRQSSTSEVLLIPQVLVRGYE